MNRKFIISFCLIFLFFFFSPCFKFACAEDYDIQQFIPEIEELSSLNFLFAQYQQDVQNANKNYYREKENELIFYRYKAKNDETLISIASRCSIRQDTLATINSISESKEIVAGKTLLLPSCDGLYIPLKPENYFELLLSSEQADNINEQTIKVKNGTREFYFLPQKKFSMSLRAYFLNPGMSMPLEKSVLTSAFGMRISPISGKWKMHKGIDLAAARGSRILACREGLVKLAAKGNPVYGNYVVLKHPNGMESLYAHMDLISVEKNQKVTTGQTLGTVGTTGLSTGPHLHFEISQNGSPLNPENYLKK
ncbi:MAG: M23 family metallopeptidase [Treponema sp.]|nr:M23 family metallopeptidase [Spirochaetia bacterium]MDD7459498.1 M23 family metallopeptidase [Spirochaetales bacterium]MDY5811008.1 M23 family metallopeptidase [Treponema sp.]